MTLSRGFTFLLALTVAVLAIGALAGYPEGLPAGASPQQKAETTMQDCAACHEDVVKAFSQTRHDTLQSSQRLKIENPCESCHGPGKAHIEGGGDAAAIIGFKGNASKTYNQQCLACHNKDHEVNGFTAGAHAKQGLDCADCHSIHSAASQTRSLKETATNLCMDCHTLQKSEFARPYHHRVTEKAMECTDCHQPHSGIDRRLLRASATGEQMCGRCHTEKQGPFLFEHAAIRLRGCQGCHEPHGSNNPKMLIRTEMTSLCLECHSRSANVITAQPPSLHNLNSATYRNCTTCHVMIHGSNFDRLFMR
jgi:DmsE family decaheme c-type cytochrome